MMHVEVMKGLCCSNLLLSLFLFIN